MSAMALDASPRPRKASTYGGSRAWSEEEESFLLESRSRKTPYKAIAQYLQKTELACRLHYHQLAYGTKRKRRSTSASCVSTATVSSVGGSLPSLTRAHTPRGSTDSGSSRVSPPPNAVLPSFSPPNSPLTAIRPRFSRSESPMEDQRAQISGMHLNAIAGTVPANEIFSPFQQLPRYSIPSGQVTEGVRRCSLYSVDPFTRDYERPSNYMATSPSPRSAPAVRASALLPLSDMPASMDLSMADGALHVDPLRLNQCYKTHKGDFWNTVARTYGGDVNPLTLEDAFLRINATSPVSSLPTPPNRSPALAAVVMTDDSDGALAKVDALPADPAAMDGRLKANSSIYSIASILTEDQEVWSQRRQTV